MKAGQLWTNHRSGSLRVHKVRRPGCQKAETSER